MKIKRFLKIVLLICCFVLTSISIALMYTVIILENNPFEYSMLIPLLMISTGILSIIYHFKTLKYYSLNIIVKDLKDGFLWVGNLLFAISILSMGLFLFYSIFNIKGINLRPEFFYMVAFCSIIFLIGVILIIEERWLYKKIINIKKQSQIDRIDNIKGSHDDDL